MKSKSRSYYEELGIQPDATPKQIRDAYRRLAKKYHPDLNSGDRRSEERFKRISEAYQVLSDPSQRMKLHKQEAVRTRAKAAGGGRQADSFSELLKKVFKSGFAASGTGQSSQVPRRGKDLTIKLELDPLDLVRGCKKRVLIKREQVCGTCKGTGLKPGTKTVQCNICLGIGEVPASRQGKTVFVTCTNCKGSGKVIRDRCLNCGGKGISRVKSQLTIDIPAGTGPEAVLTVKGQGDTGLGGKPAGDLKINIVARENAYFEARDHDIIYEYPLNLKELVRGGEVEIPSPDGNKVKLTLQPGLRQGKMLKVKGKGLLKSNGIHGDLLVRIRYHYPEKISSKAMQLLDELTSLPGWTPKKDKDGYIRRS